MEDYDRLSEDSNWVHEVNEVKKEVARNKPKVYRNGTGKRYYADKKDKLEKHKQDFVEDLEDSLEASIALDIIEGND